MTRRHRAGPRRVYRDHEWILIGMMVERGCSGGEIAEAVGATPQVIRALLHRRGVKLHRKVGQHDIIRLDCSRRDVREIRRVAYERDEDPAEMLLRVVRTLVKEPTVLSNLLDEGERHDEA